MGLSEFLKLQFILIHEHNYSIHDIENMICWERLIHTDMVKSYVEEQNLKNSRERYR